MAVTVVDDWQGKGLGRILLDALVLEALENGITRFEGDVLVENRPMQEMLRRTGARFRPEGPGRPALLDRPPGPGGGAAGLAFRGPAAGLAKGEVTLYQDEPLLPGSQVWSGSSASAIASSVAVGDAPAGPLWPHDELGDPGGDELLDAPDGAVETLRE